MAESKAIPDYPCDEILEPRTVLITNITPELEFNTPVQFFEDLKRLLGYKKRRTIVKSTTSKLSYVNLSNIIHFGLCGQNRSMHYSSGKLDATCPIPRKPSNSSHRDFPPIHNIIRF